MAGVLYIRDPETGEFVPVPTLVGPPGPGVPAGGTAGQVLVKSGEADYAAEWRNPYPPGSIYMSVNSTSPASLFGGAWEPINGRFLIGTGAPELNDDGTSPGSYNYAAGAKGGEAEHVLKQEEIPNYSIGKLPLIVPNNHAKWNNAGISASDFGSVSSSNTGIDDNGNTITSGTQYGYNINSYGGGGAHNNMPPYLAVYMWKRVS